MGSDVAIVLQQVGHEVVSLAHADIEITDVDSVKKTLTTLNPAMVINTAAFSNVPLCEKEKETAYRINALGPKNLAVVTNDIGARLLHISTDYVFDGKKQAPYVEDDEPSPLNVYGETKLAGERFIQEIAKKYIVMRVSGIYGHHPCRAKSGDNFVNMMLRLAQERGKVRVVDDEVLTPTSTIEIARQVEEIIDSDMSGLVHATAEGQCSWYEFAQEIFKITNTNVILEKADPGEFSSAVNRPKYSVLENKRLKDAGVNIFKHWKEGLREYLDKNK